MDCNSFWCIFYRHRFSDAFCTKKSKGNIEESRKYQLDQLYRDYNQDDSRSGIDRICWLLKISGGIQHSWMVHVGHFYHTLFCAKEITPQLLLKKCRDLETNLFPFDFAILHADWLGNFVCGILKSPFLGLNEKHGLKDFGFKSLWNHYQISQTIGFGW